MRRPGRLLLVAAALTTTLAVAPAGAQTVIVRNAPPGSTVELVVNSVASGSAKADAVGDARLPVKLPALVAADVEVDARLVIDVCGTTRRVQFTERAQQPPAPDDGCTRRDIPGLFIVRRITTLVVDLAGPNPALWVRQGAAPDEWLRIGPAPPRVPRAAPAGLVAFGGGSYAGITDMVGSSCGSVETCGGSSGGFAYSAGVEYWLTRWVAIEGSYFKPSGGKASADIEGSDTVLGLSFDHVLDSRVWTLAGKLGVPLGPARIYGRVGGNYHQATLDISETIDDRTVVVDEVEETIPGGSINRQIKTAGWGLFFGIGVEGWVSSRVGIFGEGGHARLRGPSVTGGPAVMEDSLNWGLFGIKIRLGRQRAAAVGGTE